MRLCEKIGHFRERDPQKSKRPLRGFLIEVSFEETLSG
jgi:hypothetical protein